MRVSQGFSGTKELYKLENEKTVSKFIKRGITKEIEWEHGNMGQFWKGTRTDPPLGDLHRSKKDYKCPGVVG